MDGGRSQGFPAREESDRTDDALSEQLEELLDSYCRKRRQTKTEVLTRLLRNHLAAASDRGKKPYPLAREFGLIGAFASGRRDASESRKRYFREKLRAKHSR